MYHGFPGGTRTQNRSIPQRYLEISYFYCIIHTFINDNRYKTFVSVSSTKNSPLTLK